MLRSGPLNRTFGLLIRRACVVAAASTLVLGVARAEKAESVIVTNPVTVANPVTTVTVANPTSTVTIGNSQPIPVSVSPGIPYQLSLYVSSNYGPNQFYQEINVPANKRLVLQYASVLLYNGASGTLSIKPSAGNTPGVYITPTQQITLPGGGLTASQNFLLFGDPGSTLQISVLYNASPAANAGALILTGYLVDP